MAAKKKTSKKEEESKEQETPEEKEEEVIEVKTSKKEEEPKEKEEKEETPTVAAKKPSISSFSQLDADKVKEEPEKEEEKKEKEPAEEKPEEKEESVKAEPLKSDSSEVSSEEAKKWLKGVSPEIETEASGEKGSKGKFVVIIVVVAIILGIIAGGFYYYRSRVSKEPSNEMVEPTPAAHVVTPSPEPTGTMEELDMSDYSVSILNGSGVPGEAGNVEDLLSDLEFDSVKTGNAESYDYEKTEVSLKKDLPEAIYNQIEPLLTDEYEVTLSETRLDPDSSYDIIIIVGSRK